MRVLVALIALLAVCAAAPGRASAVTAAFADESTIPHAVDAMTTFPTMLDPRIWDGTHMKPDVRNQSLRVVDRIVGSSGIDDLSIDAVELFGSNASYEYDETSDFGVHVFVHSAAMTTDQLAAMLALLNSDVEQRQEGQIRFYGVPLEVTFHAERTANYQPAPGVGQYSISDDAWIEPPTQQPNNFDRATMIADVTRFVAEYNGLVSEYVTAPKSFDCVRFNQLDHEMADYRGAGFANGLGSRSTQNLAYRALRRLNVSVPDMVDMLEQECTYLQESVP